MGPRRYPIWPAFTGGEVTPLADGRVDAKGYYTSCDKIMNMIPLVEGPADSRLGSRFVGEAIDSSYASRLFEFRYSADVSYTLEIGQQKMRFFAMGARVVKPELVVNGDMELDSNWTDYGTPTTNERSSEQAYEGTYSRKFIADATGEGIQSDGFETDALTHVVNLYVYSEESAVNIKVRKGDDTGWAYDSDYTLTPGVWNWVNFQYTETGAGAGAYIVICSTSADKTWYVDDVSIRPIYEISTPWQASELYLLRTRQVANAMYFVHPSYAPRKLVRNGTTDWTMSEVVFAWGPFLKQNTTSITIEPSATTGSGITLTASDSIFLSGHEGAQFKIGDRKIVEDTFSANGNGTAVVINEGEAFTIDLTGTWVADMELERSFDGGTTWYTYIKYTSNTTGELANLEDGVKWRWKMANRSSGTCNARITIANRPGYVKVTAVSSPPSTTATADVIEELPSTDATKKWAEGAFSDEQGYPRALSFYEQRLVLAATAKKPASLWASVVDDYESHEAGPVGDKAWSYTLAGAEVNQIQWMVEGDILHVGTSGDEWKFGSPNTPTTASSVNAKRQTKYGSAPVEALRIGSRVIFCEDGRRSLRAMRYDFEEDSYLADKISRKASHLLKDSWILEMVYTEHPNPVVWFVMGDGTLRTCTFDPEEEVLAFARGAMGGGGLVESASTARGIYYDEVWVETKRTINSQTVRYIEQIEAPDWEEQKDAFYVDCGLTYTGDPCKYFTGLFHLEGETVDVFADGAVVAPKTVANGMIILEDEASVVHVGYSFQRLLTPKRLELLMGAGETSQSRHKDIYEVVVRLYRSMVTRIGADEAHLEHIIFRTTDTPLGQSPALYTGDKRSSIAGPSKDGRVTVECSAPVPFTVVALMPISAITGDA